MMINERIASEEQAHLVRRERSLSRMLAKARGGKKRKAP
jgi:hypothetical protein